VLYLCGYRDEQRQALSDATCTALQLTNFWQDVRRDVLERGRVYIPEQIARAHGLDIEQMVRIIQIDATPVAGGDRVCCTTKDIPSVGVLAIHDVYRATLRDLCQRNWPLFEKGRELLPLVDADVRVDIDLFGRGGEAILRMIQKRDYDTLTTRPSLSKAAKFRLMVQALAGKFTSKLAKNRIA